MSHIYYLYADENDLFVEEYKEYLDENGVVSLPFSKLEHFDIGQASHLLVTGTLEEIKEILLLAEHTGVSIGIIPKPEQKQLIKTFYLPSDTKEAIDIALIPSEKKLDLLYAEDKIVLQEVVIGDVPPLDQYESVLEGKGLWERIKLFGTTLKRVKSLHHSSFQVIDANENTIRFSAVGIVVLKYPIKTFASKLIPAQLSASDGRLSLVVLSPGSIIQYIGYLFKSLVSRFTPKRLPNSVGYLRSSSVKIGATRVVPVVVDSACELQTPIVLVVKEEAIALSVGEKFWQEQGELTQPKDSIKLDHLPCDEESSAYLENVIPLFSHASQEQYATLFTSLREEAQLNSTFMTLLVLATMIATFGLYINSPSVIIGAMLLAPLMQPIVSMSMGMLRQDSTLSLDGLKSITIGVMSVLLTAMLVSFFTPIENLTSEMVGRLHPTILDLFVAIISGAAAAYAKSNEKIVGSLAGVAIAVALLPPLAVSGIGLGWGEWHMFGMAFLLFVTNLVGIVLAAALMFMFLGYSPLNIAKKGVTAWMVIALIIAVPLYGAFGTMKEDLKIQSRLSNTHFFIENATIQLTDVELYHRQGVDEIRCEAITSDRLSTDGEKALKEKIESLVGKEIHVVVTFRYRL
ncbi:TIGR00341 family protein [Sulfurovum sp. zt1-1]|uniref:TIGR00341 family protein n=1 Tax=Sulfurovum zhangzhouensis TaxID=3019067 RepID=A0ABT7QWT9_9BACT|nr:TIGR00341 family protein [Sulfurovum zhangzhouensis]MDM5271308.1 TIGR00341 family protein [Sulfurovum zhangzhouensis]